MPRVDVSIHALAEALDRAIALGPTAGVVLAAAGAVGFGAWPAALPFAIGAAPGALVGASLPLAGSRIAGAAAGALGLGVVGLLAAREIAALFASLAGGLLLGAGILAAFGTRPLAREVATRPVALVAFAVVAGVAGAALQIARRGGRSDPDASTIQDGSR